MIKTRTKSAVKRKQILAAATVLFTEQGYATTSMDLIAKRAEVSKQTVYSHFGSKEELFSAAIEQKCDSYQMVDMGAEDLSDPQAILMNLAERFLAMLTSKEALAVHKICAYEAKSYPQLAQLFFKAGPERIATKIAQLMTLFDQRQILAIENPQFAAWQFLNMVRGEAFIRVEFNLEEQLTKEQIQVYLANTVALFIRGYRR